jgi:serine/threonine-protein kinase
MKKCPACEETYPGDFAVCPRDGSTLVEAGAWSEGTLVRGKYRILTKLGQGGMGSVYKALHVAFNELRALKVMNPELVSDEQFVRRFKYEAVITRKLQHPNAVRVDDIDETEDGCPFIVMEYIEGQSLKKLMQQQGPLPVPRVCSVIKQVAAGLEAAHQLGMVHRDIKPDNIVLIESPQGEVAKVLDFGIAKIKEGRAQDSGGLTLTGTGVIIGTPSYMSPEQARGKRGDELDGRSDLYSLGVVMYQMLSGELPFKADTTMDMLFAHLQKQPPPIQTIRPGLNIPDGLANVLACLLEKQPESRLPTARALIQEIEKVERELAAGAPTRVKKPVVLAGEEAAQAAPAAPGVGAVPEPPPQAAPAARVGAIREPPLQVQPSPPARPAPVVAPKTSSWLVWASIAILVIAVGGAGLWYKTMRRPGVAPAAPATSQQVVPSSPGPGQATPAPAPSNTNPQTSSQPAELGPTQTQTQEPGTTGGMGSAPRVSTSSAPTTAHPSAGGGKGGFVNPPVQPPKGVDTHKISDAVQAALSQGMVYHDHAKYDEEIRLYTDALKLDPNNAALRKALDRARTAKAAEEKVSR